jgi:hypothetical protein
VYEWVERAGNARADAASKLHAQQHRWKSATVEADLRRRMEEQPAAHARSKRMRYVSGKVAVFLPMFHLVDARVEMIRSQLEEAIIVVPRWPAGGPARRTGIVAS